MSQKTASRPHPETSAFALVVIGVAVTSAVFYHAVHGQVFEGTGGVSLSGPGSSAGILVPETNPASAPNTNERNAGAETLPDRLPGATETALPGHVFIPVPFTTQAPEGKWKEPWSEACEEASVFMAMAWVRHQDDPTAAEARAGILGIVGYENAAFGYHNDTAIRETAKLFTRYSDYPRIDIEKPTGIDDIRRALAHGNIVVLPLAGAILANPFFSSPPPYHMVVAIGYDDLAQEFIVNEPGTKHGKNYRYKYEILWDAIHDWTGDDATVKTGEKAMIVVHPQP